MTKQKLSQIGLAKQRELLQPLLHYYSNTHNARMVNIDDIKNTKGLCVLQVALSKEEREKDNYVVVMVLDKDTIQLSHANEDSEVYDYKLTDKQLYIDKINELILAS